MRARLGLAVSLLALAALAAVLVGCGATVDPVAKAATNTAKAPSLRYALRVRLALPGATSPVTMTANGGYDSETSRLSMSMDLSGIAAAPGAAGRLGRLQIVEDGTVLYMSAPFLSDRLPGGKSWARLDLARAAKASGIDLSSLTAGQGDPRDSLAQLRSVGSVVKIGPATVRGVGATRYSVLVDLRKALARLSGANRDTFGRWIDQLAATGHRYVPEDVWVGADGYVRRVQAELPTISGTVGSVSVTMDFFDFGAPLQIDVPPAAAVADLGDVALPGLRP